jgi:hypothetical protein
VFIDAVAEHIPSELRNREKMGIEMPFIDWIVGGLLDSFEALLTGGAARSLFSPRYQATLQRSLRAGHPPRELWAFGILLGWMERDGVQLN